MAGGETEQGEAGARRAIAMICIATCAESSVATLAEERNKLDLKFTFSHAFNASIVTCHCQVKSGKTYRVKTPLGEPIKLVIDGATVDALRGGSQPAVFAWVPGAPSTKIYWYIFDPKVTYDRKKKPKTRPQISREKYVTPWLRYELTRAAVNSHWQPRATMVTIAEDPTESLRRRLVRAKRAYNELKGLKIQHPLIGELKVTQLAWRHVTRLSRRTRWIRASLLVAPYLKNFLVYCPDRYVVFDPKRSVAKSQTTEMRRINFYYRDAIRINGQTKTLAICVSEKVQYPRNWDKYPLNILDIKQSCKLFSWWVK